MIKQGYLIFDDNTQKSIDKEEDYRWGLLDVPFTETILNTLYLPFINIQTCQIEHVDLGSLIKFEMKQQEYKDTWGYVIRGLQSRKSCFGTRIESKGGLRKEDGKWVRPKVFYIWQAFGVHLYFHYVEYSDGKLPMLTFHTVSARPTLETGIKAHSVDGTIEWFYNGNFRIGYDYGEKQIIFDLNLLQLPHTLKQVAPFKVSYGEFLSFLLQIIDSSEGLYQLYFLPAFQKQLKYALCDEVKEVITKIQKGVEYYG